MKYYLFLIIPLLMACEDSLTLDAEKVSSIQYSFRDSSVPPPYHRSYTISISKSTAHITVNSYGDILAEKEYHITSSQFSDLITRINDANLISGSVDAEPGCTGGTGETLTIAENTIEVYKGNIDNCGGTEIPASFGDIKTVIQAIRALVPDLNNLLKT